MIGIQLGKIVLGDVKIISKVTKSIVVKAIAAVAVFFIPSIVSIVLSFAGQISYTATACWNNAGIDLLMNKLATGKYLALILVADNTGRGIFTSGGYYFVLTGVKNGEFTIAQVSRPAQNNQTWPLSAFDGDVSNFYLVTQKGLIKKVLLVLIALFVLTGCTAKYELTYENDVFSEHIVIYEEKINGSLSEFGINRVKQILIWLN